MHNPTLSKDTFFSSPDIKPPLNDDWAARRELADVVRQLISRLVTTTSDAATLRATTDLLKAQLAILDQSPQLAGRKAHAQAGNAYRGDLHSLSHELNPLDGQCNPLAAPLRIWIDATGGHGRVTLGWAYEGPPGAVHGGHVCALLDHFLGITQTMTGQAGLTGVLNVRFHLPTPLNTELELRGRVKEVRGRNNVMIGEVFANGQLTASCQGIFVHAGDDGFAV
ncbi:MAG: hypothetical protein KUL75_03700 [Sterolibacterium sp.]|nr:hypothetical protein [Sterolibacterium sp.]